MEVLYTGVSGFFCWPSASADLNAGKGVNNQVFFSRDVADGVTVLGDCC